MDGMLSQDEINALLSGMDLSAGADDSSPVAEEPAETPTEFYSGAGATSAGEAALTEVEQDAIGEVANISMGSSATTL